MSFQGTGPDSVATEVEARSDQRNHADPMIVLPWRVWAQLLAKVRSCS